MAKERKTKAATKFLGAAACFQKRAIRSEGPPGVNRASFAWSVSFVH